MLGTVSGVRLAADLLHREVMIWTWVKYAMDVVMSNHRTSALGEHCRVRPSRVLTRVVCPSHWMSTNPVWWSYLLQSCQCPRRPVAPRTFLSRVHESRLPHPRCGLRCLMIMLLAIARASSAHGHLTPSCSKTVFGVPRLSCGARRTAVAVAATTKSVRKKYGELVCRDRHGHRVSARQ